MTPARVTRTGLTTIPHRVLMILALCSMYSDTVILTCCRWVVAEIVVVCAEIAKFSTRASSHLTL